VRLSQIQPAISFARNDLFDVLDNTLFGKSGQLMQTFDQINRRFPKSISMAASGFDKTWIAKARGNILSHEHKITKMVYKVVN
jgi:DNA polymerase V